MNVDRILSTLNEHHVEYLLIGGMNYLLRHEPVLTYDVDIWIHDTEPNLSHCEAALTALEARWGETEDDWQPVSRLPQAWLARQPLYCLTSPHGAIDVFRTVAGLDDWRACAARAVSGTTAGGVAYRGLADSDMLASQLALPPGGRKTARIRRLEQASGGGCA